MSSFYTGLLFITIALAVSARDCPDDRWILDSGFCYFFQPDDTANWGKARYLCKKAGDYTSDLISIQSEDENDFVTELMSDLSISPNPRNFWIVMSKDGPNSSYIWRDYSNSTYRNWGTGQPSDANGGYKNCVEVVFNDGDWKDNSCYALNGYACRMPKMPPTTTSTSTITTPTATPTATVAQVQNQHFENLGGSTKDRHAKMRRVTTRGGWKYY